MAEPEGPESRAETVRESLRRVLRERPTTLRELSGALSVSEKDLAGHSTLRVDARWGNFRGSAPR